MKKILLNKVFLILYLVGLSFLLASCQKEPDQETAASPLAIEKTTLTIGFVKLTDMAPLAIAVEKGFFKDEGLNVKLEAQPSWAVLYERVQKDELDAAHMLAAMPLASFIDPSSNKTPIITPFTLSYNGAAITVSNNVWGEMKKNVPMEHNLPKHPISASSLRPVIAQYKQQQKLFKLGMTFPTGTHNYMLRYWLAAGGIHPGTYDPAHNNTSGNIGSDVDLTVIPPPEMISTMVEGVTSGYSVGEPWNQKAVKKGFGVSVITSDAIWENGADKVFGLTQKFAQQNPTTTLKLVKALIRASHWLDENNYANRKEATEIIAQDNYIRVDKDIIANSMTGVFEYEPGDVRPAKSFHTFFKGQYGIPYYSDAVWWLTQMRRWGQISTSQTDQWYLETAKQVYRPDLYTQAAQALIDEGKMQVTQFPTLKSNAFIKAPQTSPLDQVVFDAHQPNRFLAAFKIGYK